MNTFDNIYFWYALFALIVIVLGLILSKYLKVRISKNGFAMDAKKELDHDNVKVKKIRNNSSVDLNTKKATNIEVENIDNSDVKINKNI